MAKVTGAGAAGGALIDDFAVYWPPNTGPANTGVGSQFERDGMTKDGAPIGNLFNAFAGGGFGELMALYNGNIPIGRIINNAGGLDRYSHTNTSMRFLIAQGSGALPNLGTASILPRIYRVQRIVWLMRATVNNPVGGLRISIAQATGPSAGNGLSFGICGDGLGNYEWVTNRSTVIGNVTERVALNLANPAQLHLFELEIINAVGVGTSTVRVYADNTQRLERAFTPAGVLPLHIDYPGGNTMFYCVHISSNDGNALIPNAEVELGPMSFIFSRYDRRGNLIDGAG